VNRPAPSPTSSESVSATQRSSGVGPGRAAQLARVAALPALSGLLYFLSWIGFGIWPLAFICFVPLLYALRELTPRQALRRGAWMGFITHLGGYTWIVHLLKDFAFLPTPLAVLGYVLICAAQGFLFAVFAWILRHAWIRSGWSLAALVPLALCATELAYPLLFQSYTGVSLMPALPLIQMADLGGVLLLSALQAVVNGALAELLFFFAARKAAPGVIPSATAPRVPYASLTAALLFLAASIGYGELRLSQMRAAEKAAPKQQVGLAQPNVGEVELHEHPFAAVRALWDETAELQVRGADLVIWPEAAFNLQLVDVTRRELGKSISDHIPVNIVAGMMRGEMGTQHVWNSAVSISADGMLGDHYDKIALLAFGEYIPFGDTFPILYRWSPMASPLSRGVTTAPLREGPWLLATSICYEGILPRTVAKTMEDYGGGRANLLVNLTNDSWYGAGHEQEQHLMLAAMRTVEHRRWLARATSTGVSAFADSMGRLVQTIPRDTRGVAMQEVPMLSGTTVYERLGDWPGYLSLLILAGIFLRARLQRGKA